jgi:hypothetical protein
MKLIAGEASSSNLSLVYLPHPAEQSLVADNKFLRRCFPGRKIHPAAHPLNCHDCFGCPVGQLRNQQTLVIGDVISAVPPIGYVFRQRQRVSEHRCPETVAANLEDLCEYSFAQFDAILQLLNVDVL